MSDGLSLSLQDLPRLPPGDITPIPSMEPIIDLTTFMLWIELQPLSTVTGMLEIIGNTLYRHGRFTEGNEIKHVVTELRG